MKPADTRQEARRRNAVRGAVSSAAFQIAAAMILLWLRAGTSGFLADLLLLIAAADVVTVIPMWLSLRERLKEIEGGEEEEASQY